MKWNKYALKTKSYAVDLVSGIFMELGIEGLEILENGESEEVQVIFYLEENADPDILSELSRNLDGIREFVDIGDAAISVSVTEDTEWVNNWKKYFKSFNVDDMIIKPAWEKTGVETEGKMLISIDPGTSFGTGKHETTRLCIRQLKKHVRTGDAILDVGCGSGILSVVAAKLGAGQITGIDIEEDAVEAAVENVRINGIEAGTIRLLQGDMISSREIRDTIGYECYDIVVANILAVVIVPLTPFVADHLKPGGIYIISGMLDTQEPAIRRALDETGKFEIMDRTEEGDWISMTARKIIR
ncbi:50S ribosomal protein L11 methyltransferase [Parasporobacterium paucivorans]|uniref:Ribosomal protein L11 methyltransferase n=1 Tax=Parasporobacterium paucivorans DSM 15970 TaxID=1122934 RepID=A0A1M6C0Z3_9FIRM|nr:50S ribosomal protein L11 methyltransferase [Parasporobacterium paucivorans]SHI54709.1 ribosomal protein L11 methyltransferase [Parasporobacterium paucivorans DSM 15970]